MRILAGLPKEGRDAYQKLFGVAGAELLARLKTKFDLATATRLADRYRFTKEGAEGLLLLADHHLQAHQDYLAAWCFAHLLQHANVPALAESKLFQAAIVLRRGLSRSR